MKITVIMIDGSFRENVFGSHYFCDQDFPPDEFEVLWVEFYQRANLSIKPHSNLNVISLGHSKDTVYHSSLCFNEGIRQAKGELILIPDADQIVAPDFLSKVWQTHQRNDRLVAYGYRYDEIGERSIQEYTFDELEAKCTLKNPTNYGGCLTARKKWLLEINGYEQHDIFSTGFHANGLDMYTRLKNLGLDIQWNPDLKLYHPWHPFSRTYAPQYQVQKKVINWRAKKLCYLPFEGIDENKNTMPPDLTVFHEDRAKNSNLLEKGLYKVKSLLNSSLK